MTDIEEADHREIVDQLLYDPPRDRDELARRTGGAALGELRDALMERIEEGELDDVDAIVAGNLFNVLGLDGERDRLIDIVSSPMPDASDEHRQARKAAFVSLAMNSEFDPEDPDVTFGLSPERYTELAASVYSSLFEFTELNIELVYDLGHMLMQEPAEVRSQLFEQLESYRSDTFVDAGILYRPLLEDQTFSELWPLLVDAVVEEGVPRDADWLERLANQVPESADEQLFRKAVMELRTKGIGAVEAPAGFALVGTPDGAGAYPIFVFTKRDEKVFAGHNVVFRHLSHTVRDGFFIPNIVDEEVDQLVEDIEETRATRLTEVPVEVGIRLVQRELESMEEPVADLPPETRLAVYRLERLPAGDVELPEIEPADAIDAQRVRAVFKEEGCFDSWFFDRTTLERAEVLPVPDSDDEAENWKANVAPRLAGMEGVAERVVENLRFVASWFAFDGGEELASQFAALAEESAADFEGSLGLDMVLDHTIRAVREMQDYAGAFLFELLGDDSLRANLHDQHLEAKGFDEETERLYLDNMELSYRTLEEMCPEIPEHLMPEPGAIMDSAGPIGIVMANFFGRTPIGPPDELAKSVSDELQQAGFDERVAGLFVPELLTNGRLLAMIREE